ncbi:tol-pal system protein YbgF [Magnetospira sp. QH-2]|uniref:tol-pal system protein YbgF n=1 Tax=Magnetospira sp. (strain QH-2) TaxID=1288970 RepID=UPI0003E81813|nr:tol-pal system protein YbgF [Magnetospira sp. QH-2]CCQ73319.1 Conserved exported protein of unknown function [Magnetospira sp. QH-2]
MVGIKLGGFGSVAAVLVSLIAVTPSWAQDGQALADRLDRLERDIQAVTRMVARGGTPTASADGAPAPTLEAGPVAARLSVRVQAVERDMQALTGRAEEINFRLDQLDKRLEKLVSDMEFRLTALEQRGGVAGQVPRSGHPSLPAPMAAGAENMGTLTPADRLPPPVASTSPSSMGAKPGTLGTIGQSDLASVRNQARNPQQQLPPPTQPSPAGGQAIDPATPSPAETAKITLPEGSARDQYSYAFGLLRKTEYAQAETALKAFIDKYDDSSEPLVGNARYWLGETYYVRSDFVSAAKTFFEGYNKHPKGNKAPDTLLKLGMALANLGKPKEACGTFGKLLEDHTKAPATLRKRAQSEMRRTGCE